MVTPLVPTSPTGKPLPPLPSSESDFPPASQPRPQSPGLWSQPQSPTSPRRRTGLSLLEDTGSREVADLFSALEQSMRGHQRQRSMGGEPRSPRLDPYSRPGSPLARPTSPSRPTSPIRQPRSVARPTARRDVVVSYDVPASGFFGPPYRSATR